MSPANPRSGALALFAATGDLVRVARSGWSREQVLERAKARVAEQGGGVDVADVGGWNALQ